MAGCNIVSTENGSIAPACLLALVISTGLVAIFLGATIHYHRQVINQVKGMRCIQQFNRQLQTHHRRIEQLNQVIINVRLAQALAVLFPPLLTAGASAEKIRSTAMLLQWVDAVSFQKNTAAAFASGCPLPVTALVSPFTVAGVRVQQDSQKRAILRSQKWKHIFQLTLKRIVQVDYSAGATLHWSSSVVW